MHKQLQQFSPDLVKGKSKGGINLKAQSLKKAKDCNWGSVSSLNYLCLAPTRGHREATLSL